MTLAPDQPQHEAAKRPPVVLYHYTSEVHLPHILAAGHLRLTDSNIELSGAGPGVVWLTSTETPGGNGLEGGVDKGAVRFTLKPPPNTHWWPEWSREQGIEEFWYSALARAAGGDPENWWVCTDEIPLERIEKIEVHGKAYDFRKQSKIEVTGAIEDPHMHRGLVWALPSTKRGLELAKKVAAGTITAREIVDAVGKNGMGVWWGIAEQYGEDSFRAHAEGSLDPDLYAAGALRVMAEEIAYWKAKDPDKPEPTWVAGVESWREYLRGQLDPGDGEPPRWYGCDVPVVFTAKRPMRDGVMWDPAEHNPSNGFMGNSYLRDGEPIEIVGVEYSPDGQQWKRLPMSGSIRTKASKTAGPMDDYIPLRFRSPVPPTRDQMDDPRKVVFDRPALEDIEDLPGDIRNALQRALADLQDGTDDLDAKHGELAGVYTVRLTPKWRAAVYLGADGHWHCFYVGPHTYDEVAKRWNRTGSKTAVPSWRDRGEHPEAEALIVPDTGRSRRNSYSVYLYGQPHARRDSLEAAKAVVEEIYGPLDWKRLSGDEKAHHDRVWGPTTMFNDAPYYLCVERLPRLGTTASGERTLYHGCSKASATEILRDGPRAGLNLTSNPDAARMYARYESGGTAWTKDKRKQGVVLEVRVRPEETRVGDYGANHHHIRDHAVTIVALPADRVSVMGERTASASDFPIQYTVRVEFGRRRPDAQPSAEGPVEPPYLDIHAGERYVTVWARSEAEAKTMAAEMVAAGSDSARNPIGHTGDMPTKAEVIRAEASSSLTFEVHRDRRAAKNLPPRLRFTFDDPTGSGGGRIIAWDDDSTHPRDHEVGIGMLSWNKRGTVTWVQVYDDHYQRRGIATAMWQEALKHEPRLRHSRELSESGRAWSRTTKAAVATPEHWRPTGGMFARGQDTLDPRVFDVRTQQMRRDIRDSVLAALDNYWTPRYGDWRAWAKVYLAGSGASYWWDSDADMDILIGLDLDRLREVRPANKEVADEDILGHLNRELREDLRPTTTTLNGFETTWFINGDSFDILKIHPYAAYDLTADEWVVKPPVLPANWGPDSIPEETWRRCEQAAVNAIEVLSLPEPERTVAGTVYFDWVHEGRRAAYSAYGGGWLDPGNVIYQYLSQHPEKLLRKLFLCKHPEQATDADAIEVTAGYDPPEGITYEYTPDRGTEGRGITGPGAMIEAKVDGKVVGGLAWYTTFVPGGMGHQQGQVEGVFVEEPYQRRGIATEMWRRAKEIEPRLHHSHALTDDGRAWSQVTAARLPTALLRSILDAQPWLDSKAEEVLAGKVPGMEMDPNISPGLAGHSYRSDALVFSPTWWRTHDEFSRFLLVTHEIGHSVPLEKVQAHPDFAEVFGEHKGGGRYALGNPWGVQENLSEMVADGYSEICLRGPNGYYEDPEYPPARALKIIAEVARAAGMPVGQVRQAVRTVASKTASEDLGPEWKGNGIYEMDISHWSTTGCVALMANVAGTVWPLGWLTWDRDRHTIEGIYVNDGYRGKGIAIEMLKAAEKVAGTSLRNDSGEYTAAGFAWAKKRGINPKMQNRISDAEMSRMVARMNNLLIGSTDLIKRQIQKAGARAAKTAAGTVTVYRGIYLGLESEDYDRLPQCLTQRILEGGSSFNYGAFKENLGVHWTTDRRVAEYFATPMTRRGEKPTLGSDGWGVDVPVIVTARVSSDDVVTDEEELRDAMVEGHGWNGIPSTTRLPEKEVLVRPGAPIEVVSIEALSPSQWWRVRQAVENFEAANVRNFKVEWKQIGGGMRATANLAWYSKEWRWQDWARRNGHKGLIEKQSLPTLRKAVQDVLADHGVTAPLDISVGSAGLGYSEGGLIDGKAYVLINPDEKNLWNALHEAAHVVCDHMGMDHFDSNHGEGFRRVFSEILEVHGGIDSVDLDRNPPQRTAGRQATSSMDTREIYSRTDRIREHVKRVTNAEATALLRRVLTDANFPQGAEAYTDTSPMQSSSVIGWDLDTTPPIPVIYLHPRSMTDLVLLHEAAHLLWLGGYRGANHGFSKEQVHDQRWFEIWADLIHRYAAWATKYEFDRSFGIVQDPEWEKNAPLVMRG